MADEERMKVDSPIFGESILPIETERQVIQEAVDKMPVAVFQALNKKLNERGRCLTISTL